MSRWLRFVKPTLVVAGVWGVAWSVIGLALGFLLSLMMIGAPLGIMLLGLSLNVMVATTVGFGIAGFTAGALFALALTLLEWGAPAEQLQTSRVALAGAIGGAAMPALGVLSAEAGMSFMGLAIPVVFFAVLGLVSSLVTLRLVRGPARRELEGAVTSTQG